MLLLLGIALYFVAVSAALALIGVPALRRWRLPAGRGWPRLPGRAAGAALALALLVLVAVPLGTASLRARHGYDGYDPTAAEPGHPLVAALLEGEQLVPPPPLPPELFTTPEVVEAVPLAANASRRWELLDADFRQRLLQVFRLMREQHGYEMVLIEGWRSPERQAELAALGAHVTRAGPGRSWHQHGLAADCAFLRDGRIVITERDPWAARGYALYGETAAALGLTWGGSWRSIKDLGHVELPRPPAGG